MKITFEDVKFHAVGMAKFLGYLWRRIISSGYWSFIFGATSRYWLPVKHAWTLVLGQLFSESVGVFGYVLFRPKREAE
jgi:hypothetical protein